MNGNLHSTGDEDANALFYQLLSDPANDYPLDFSSTLMTPHSRTPNENSGNSTFDTHHKDDENNFRQNDYTNNHAATTYNGFTQPGNIPQGYNNSDQSNRRASYKLDSAAIPLSPSSAEYGAAAAFAGATSNNSGGLYGSGTHGNNSNPSEAEIMSIFGPENDQNSNFATPSFHINEHNGVSPYANQVNGNASSSIYNQDPGSEFDSNVGSQYFNNEYGEYANPLGVDEPYFDQVDTLAPPSSGSQAPAQPPRSALSAQLAQFKDSYSESLWSPMDGTGSVNSPASVFSPHTNVSPHESDPISQNSRRESVVNPAETGNNDILGSIPHSNVSSFSNRNNYIHGHFDYSTDPLASSFNDTASNFDYGEPLSPSAKPPMSVRSSIDASSVGSFGGPLDISGSRKSSISRSYSQTPLSGSGAAPISIAGSRRQSSVASSVAGVFKGTPTYRSRASVPVNAYSLNDLGTSINGSSSVNGGTGSYSRPSSSLRDIDLSLSSSVSDPRGDDGLYGTTGTNSAASSVPDSVPTGAVFNTQGNPQDPRPQQIPSSVPNSNTLSRSSSKNGKNPPVKEEVPKKRANMSKEGVVPISQDTTCSNCHTSKTPLWRRNPQGDPLCNACGLFLKLHGETRPLKFKSDVIKKRNRQNKPRKSAADIRNPNAAEPPNAGNKNRPANANVAPSVLAKSHEITSGPYNLHQQENNSLSPSHQERFDASPKSSLSPRTPHNMMSSNYSIESVQNLFGIPSSAVNSASISETSSKAATPEFDASSQYSPSFPSSRAGSIQTSHSDLQRQRLRDAGASWDQYTMHTATPHQYSFDHTDNFAYLSENVGDQLGDNGNQLNPSMNFMGPKPVEATISTTKSTAESSLPDDSPKSDENSKWDWLRIK